MAAVPFSSITAAAAHRHNRRRRLHMGFLTVWVRIIASQRGTRNEARPEEENDDDKGRHPSRLVSHHHCRRLLVPQDYPAFKVVRTARRTIFFIRTPAMEHENQT